MRQRTQFTGLQLTVAGHPRAAGVAGAAGAGSELQAAAGRLARWLLRQRFGDGRHEVQLRLVTLMRVPVRQRDAAGVAAQVVRGYVVNGEQRGERLRLRVLLAPTVGQREKRFARRVGWKETTFWVQFDKQNFIVTRGRLQLEQVAAPQPGHAQRLGDVARQGHLADQGGVCAQRRLPAPRQRLDSRAGAAGRQGQRNRRLAAAGAAGGPDRELEARVGLQGAAREAQRAGVPLAGVGTAPADSSPPPPLAC